MLYFQFVGISSVARTLLRYSKIEIPKGVKSYSLIMWELTSVKAFLTQEYFSTSSVKLSGPGALWLGKFNKQLINSY